MIFNKFFRKYDFSMVLALGLLPLASIIGIPLYAYYNGIVWQEPVMLVIGWFLAGSGITMGYHRLFAHKAFKAKPVLEWILMLCGSRHITYKGNFLLNQQIKQRRFPYIGTANQHNLFFHHLGLKWRVLF